MSRGRFITFEGGEGCGKSTQVARLKDALERENVRVLLTREPGGTWLSEQIRHLIKDQATDVPCDRSELLLFLAARAQLVKNVIRPALEDGVWVISDRFSDSTLAYQGYGRGLPLDILRDMNSFACEGLKPDLTFLLQVDSATSCLRMRRREQETQTESDRIERAGADFHARIANGFLQMAHEEPERIVVIDANGAIDAVWEKIWMSMRRFR